MKLEGCTSISCNNFNCDYCKRCSHAVYFGFGKDEFGKVWRWTFNSMFGPMFKDKKGDDILCQPEANSPAWVLFELWQYRFCHDKKHPLRNVLNNMKTRCYNTKDKLYFRYGGRGIKVCEKWMENSNSFYAFALSNGWDAGLQIDRKDNNGDYEPDNCRFITSLENNRNRLGTEKSIKTLSDNGEKCRKKVKNISTGDVFISGTHAARSLGFHENAVRKAINRNTRCGGDYWEYV